MKAIIRDLSAMALIAALFMLGGVLAIDALEWEQTGSCRDCILLTAIRPALDDNPTIAESNPHWMRDSRYVQP